MPTLLQTQHSRLGQGRSGKGLVRWGEAVLLLELQRATPCGYLEERGMPLVQMWLALLLSGYGVEQRGEFYDAGTIWVTELQFSTSIRLAIAVNRWSYRSRIHSAVGLFQGSCRVLA